MIYVSDERPRTIATLADALQRKTVDHLKKLAVVLSDEKNKPVRKPDLVEFIRSRVMGAPDRTPQIEADPLRVFWRRLNALQQAAVAEIVHGPDAFFDAERFQAKYGRVPDLLQGDYYGYQQTASLLDLVVHGGVMPDDLRLRFKAFVPEPEPVRLSPQDEIPAEWKLIYEEWDAQTRAKKVYQYLVPITRRLTERAALHDLKAVLRLIDAGKLTVSDKTQQPGVTALRAVGALLLGGDFYDDSADNQQEKIGPIKAFAWPMLVQVGGLASLDGKTLQLTKAGQKALIDPMEKTLARLWQRWLKTTAFDELRRIDYIKGQTGKGKHYLTAVTGRRAAMQQALRGCPPGQWIQVDDLFRQMRATGAGFEVTRDHWSLYISESGYGSLGYEGFHSWMLLQGRYAFCLLFEYAATLGLIDVAYIPPHDARPDYRGNWGADDFAFFSRYDGLLYFRINPLGAYVLELVDRYQPSAVEIAAAAVPVLRVLPNLEIAAIGAPLEPADAMLLDSYAEKVSDAVWRLEQGRLLEALEAGHDVAVLMELLVALSGQPLPETVERFLGDMAQRAGSLRSVDTARLIECADAVLATLIANDSRTKPYCLLAGERHLAVPAATESRFRSALRKLGYGLPK